MDVIMPEMGEGVVEGTIVSWLVQEGDHVEIDDPILEIETDKVTVEVAAEASGIITQINVAEGETVSAGTTLAVIGQADGTPVTETAREPVTQSAGSQPAPQPYGNGIHQEEVAPKRGYTRQIDGVRVSPVVARMVEEHNLNVHDIHGTGRNQRITKRDVLNHLQQIERQTTAPPKQPTPQKAAVEPEASDGDTIMPLDGMRQAIAEHMVRSKQTSPHVTTVFEFDYSTVAAHRAAHKEKFAQDGVKLTYMPYLVQATVHALKNHPMVNASWTDDGILLRQAVNIGIAVAMPKGLLVPVIQNADQLNLFGLAKAINDLADRARNNQLKPTEVRGGTFSITNHGASGSLIGTPIINQPQVGILGIGVIEKRVKVINDAIAIRPCAFVSFSFDHRILDGATADAFIMDVKTYIEAYN
jgi:2-oxoglutarate dehydrogenase complex dihydrolipoamide succinyltransferase (E2) component